MRRFSASSALIATLLLFGVSAAHSAPKPEVVGINGQVKGREARVKFTLRNAFTPEMVEALKSGIEISFRTVVRVERVHRGWFDTSLGEVRFSRSVRYDSLSKVYRLHRGGAEVLLPDIHAALAGMTEYDIPVPIFMDAEQGKLYRAYVRTRLGKVGLSESLRSVFFFSSLWDVETDWGRGRLDAP